MGTYVCSMPNARGGSGFPHLITEDDAEIAAFVAKWDKPDRALYYCPNTLKPGATRRCIENIASIDVLHVDIDHKGLAPRRTQSTTG